MDVSMTETVPEQKSLPGAAAESRVSAVVRVARRHSVAMHWQALRTMALRIHKRPVFRQNIKMDRCGMNTGQDEQPESLDG